MKYRKIAIIVLIVLAAGFIGISVFTGHQVVSNSTQLSEPENPFHAHESYLNKFHLDYKAFTEKYRMETMFFTSTLDGHQIPAVLIYADDSAEKDHNTVIMVHGLGGNRTTVFPAAQVFLENGYNVLAYDQRSSGQNAARHTTFGYLEKYDLQDCAIQVKAWAPDKRMGVWGSSFGGITSVLAVCDPDIFLLSATDFLVLDSPVSNMEDELRLVMDSEDMGGIPTDYLIWTGNIMNKLELGFTYKEADGRYIIKSRLDQKGVRDKAVPLLIFICEGDDVTPYPMGKDLYDVYPSENKTLISFEGSEHASAWRDHEEAYRIAVEALLNSLK